MEAGYAFFMLSGCFHGGSTNKTESEERLMYSCFFTREWLRQEENQVGGIRSFMIVHEINFHIQILANPIEAIRALPEWLQERVGFGLNRPSLGRVDLANPMHLLHPEKNKRKDLW
jgi:ectoine hydroxylase-related dioxygenase (phytanoyl-CoA dioxygenase family)